MPSMEWSSARKRWEKTCVKCKLVYTSTHDNYEEAHDKISRYFSKNTGRSFDSLQSWCKDCSNDNRGGRIPNGLSRNDMLMRQGGLCFLCDRPVDFKILGSANVDHDPETGLIRKILCTNCNRGMHYVDDKKWWARATKYREDHRK